MDPSFYTNGLDPLQNKREKPGKEHRNEKYSSPIFSEAAESPLHHTFLMVHQAAISQGGKPPS